MPVALQSKTNTTRTRQTTEGNHITTTTLRSHHRSQTTPATLRNTTRIYPLPERPEALVEDVYALQIKADVLGAHLEAYIDMQPTLETLRPCNRFGPRETGISKLPIELLDQVEEYLLEDERKKLRLKWAYTRKCFADGLYPTDHFSHDELHAIEQRRTLCKPRGYLDTSNISKCIDKECRHSDIFLQKVKGMINSKYYNTYFDRLEEAQLNWKCWMGKPGYAFEGIESKMNMMSANMEKDFGLRVKVFFDPMDWDSLDGEPTPTYLLLPQKMGSTMTAPPLARFTKAVKSLKLEV